MLTGGNTACYTVLTFSGNTAGWIENKSPLRLTVGKRYTVTSKAGMQKAWRPAEWVTVENGKEYSPRILKTSYHTVDRNRRPKVDRRWIGFETPKWTFYGLSVCNEKTVSKENRGMVYAIGRKLLHGVTVTKGKPFYRLRVRDAFKGLRGLCDNAEK